MLVDEIVAEFVRQRKPSAGGVGTERTRHIAKDVEATAATLEHPVEVVAVVGVVHLAAGRINAAAGDSFEVGFAYLGRKGLEVEVW